MNPSSSAPGDLYNANLALCLRFNELMQAGGQHWVDSQTRFFESAVADSTADRARLVQHKPGKATTLSTGESLRSDAKRWSDRVQAARSSAFERQRSLSTGLRDAVTTWGRTVSESIARSNGITPFTDAWLVELTKWTQAWPVVGKAS